MKTMIALSTIALAMAATPVLAADDDYRTTSTTVEQNGNAGYTVDTTREKTDAYGNTVKVDRVTTVPADTATTTTKQVERDYTDPYGNTTKVVTKRSADTSGDSVDKRVERETTDAYGNQTKVVTDHTTDAYGNQSTTRVEQTTPGQ